MFARTGWYTRVHADSVRSRRGARSAVEWLSKPSLNRAQFECLGTRTQASSSAVYRGKGYSLPGRAPRRRADFRAAA